MEKFVRRRKVTPLAGVWIEIIFYRLLEPHSAVTPLAGVWIEIRYCT